MGAKGSGGHEPVEFIAFSISAKEYGFAGRMFMLLIDT
jgi:hypothetical protein